MALSLAEGEYVAITKCSQDLLWVSNLLQEITASNFKLILHTDNQSAMAIAENPIYHHGSRHMNFRYHFIRDLIQSGQISLKYSPSKSLLSDLLTKNLTGGRTAELTTSILGQGSSKLKIEEECGK